MRVSKPPEQRRAELLAAARALFDEKGVEKTRVSDIVRRVGVAQGVFYYYFSSKEQLVDQVVRQVAGELSAEVDEILTSPQHIAAKVAAYIELYIGFVDGFLADDATSTLPLAAGLYANNELLQAGRARLAEGWRRLVAAGVRAGEIDIQHPAETADVLRLGLEGLAAQKLPGRSVIYAIAGQALGINLNGVSSSNKI